MKRTMRNKRGAKTDVSATPMKVMPQMTQITKMRFSKRPTGEHHTRVKYDRPLFTSITTFSHKKKVYKREKIEVFEIDNILCHSYQRYLQRAEAGARTLYTHV